MDTQRPHNNNSTVSIPTPIHQLLAHTIKGLTMDAIEKANSGHPGMPMGMADTAAILWLDYLRHDPTDCDWPDRDRFVLSAGHGSMLLYSLLHLTGYSQVTLSELKQFRSLHSLTAGHPESHLIDGVETTTGPLGQGFANAVGMAIAERFLAEKYNRPGYPVIDHTTWAIAGDGCMMEGISSEAASLAGHLRLDKLIVIYDDNGISIDGSTKITFTEDVGRRFEAYGWRVLETDGHDSTQIKSTFDLAKQRDGRPTLIRCKTHIGHGAPNKQDTAKAHGSPLGSAEVTAVKSAMGWATEPFFVPPALMDAMETFRAQWAAERFRWQTMFTEYESVHTELAAELKQVWSGNLPPSLETFLPSFAPGESLATRKSSGTVIQALAKHLPNLIGGSADLEESTNTRIHPDGHMTADSFTVRNIHFGVREHAMGAICNGLALHGGPIPFCATFLQFSDYMRPAIRLAALMQQRVIYVFTHDSIFLGEDGPTHQPVEHLSALRVIPNLSVIRPADANETAAAWNAALTRIEGPTALALTRQNVPTLETTAKLAPEGVRRGAYVIWSDPTGTIPQILLLASGSEVHVAIEAAKLLVSAGKRVRVISFPSWDRFDAQPSDYRKTVLDPAVCVRVVVEAGRRQGWEKYAGPFGAYVTVEQFGLSAPASDLANEFGFNPQQIAEIASAAWSAFETNAPAWIRSVHNALTSAN
ncbi:MAG: transketolase [Myxococcales bacterium]|nr:transketolase [Myxococcales bacterium]